MGLLFFVDPMGFQNKITIQYFYSVFAIEIILFTILIVSMGTFFARVILKTKVFVAKLKGFLLVLFPILALGMIIIVLFQFIGYSLHRYQTFHFLRLARAFVILFYGLEMIVFTVRTFILSVTLYKLKKNKSNSSESKNKEYQRLFVNMLFLTIGLLFGFVGLIGILLQKILFDPKAFIVFLSFIHISFLVVGVSSCLFFQPKINKKGKHDKFKNEKK